MIDGLLSLRTGNVESVSMPWSYQLYNAVTNQWSWWISFPGGSLQIVFVSLLGLVFPYSMSTVQWNNHAFGPQEHDTQVRQVDCSIVYWCIVEGVCRRNLPLQQLTWSGVMSISVAIHIVHFPLSRLSSQEVHGVISQHNIRLQIHMRSWLGYSHHKHQVCHSPARDTEKLTNVWPKYFGTNRIIDNCHWFPGVIWRKRNNHLDIMRTFLSSLKV